MASQSTAKKLNKNNRKMCDETTEVGILQFFLLVRFITWVYETSAGMENYKISLVWCVAKTVKNVFQSTYIAKGPMVQDESLKNYCKRICVNSYVCSTYE
jgi:hypothetical protein